MSVKILLVNWGTESAAYPLSETVKRFGDQIYLAATPDLPISIKKIFKPQNIIYTNPYQEKKIVEDVTAFATENQISFDVVTTFFEMNVYQTSVLADFLGCKYFLPPAVALKTSVNKFLMRSALEQSQAKQPRFYSFSANNLEQGYEFFRQLRKHAIIKPVHSGHSYGARFIRRNSTFIEFRQFISQALNDLYKEYDEWMEYEDKNQVRFLIEEFIDGVMVSCDGVVQEKGKIVFIGNAEFKLSEKPFLHQAGHLVPIASLNKKQIAKCRAYVKKIIIKLGLQYCGFHCELKMKGDQPYLIEISGRLPGGVLLETHQHVSKIDIFKLFFSVFSSSQVIKEKNQNFVKAEVVLNINHSQSSGVVTKAEYSQIQPPSQVELELSSINQKDVCFGREGELQMWLFQLILRSKKISSDKLWTVAESLAKKAQVEVKSISPFLLGKFILFEEFPKWLHQHSKKKFGG